jgi:hypothetical protein
LLIYFASISFSKVSLVMATKRLLKAMYANGHYLDWVQLWFLPHLFVVSLFAYLFYMVVKRIPRVPVKWLALGTLYILGVVTIGIFWPFEFNFWSKS